MSKLQFLLENGVWRKLKPKLGDLLEKNYKINKKKKKNMNKKHDFLRRNTALKLKSCSKTE